MTARHLRLVDDTYLATLPPAPTVDDETEANLWRMYQTMRAAETGTTPDVGEVGRLNDDERAWLTARRQQVVIPQLAPTVEPPPPIRTMVDNGPQVLLTADQQAWLRVAPEHRRCSRTGPTVTYRAPCPEAAGLRGTAWDAPRRSVSRSPWRAASVFLSPPITGRPVRAPADWFRMWGIHPDPVGLFLAFKAVNHDGRSARGTLYRSGCVTIDRSWDARPQDGGLYLAPTPRWARQFASTPDFKTKYPGEDPTMLLVAAPSDQVRWDPDRPHQVQVEWCWTIGEVVNDGED